MFVSFFSFTPSGFSCCPFVGVVILLLIRWLFVLPWFVFLFVLSSFIVMQKMVSFLVLRIFRQGSRRVATYISVLLPYGAVGWFVICDCSIFSSYEFSVVVL